ncbi:DUF2306 domain-containing protein [Bacillus sp. SA1-12]|uniref:DUF2306 domain-containing protein n=1 Tax=Bacillus sp. SA1-12 TaxID=1455638 RepID=UPI000A4D6004|nr:DUF2306 domain-containing protein [Bacillus sp. SA1-12]
MKTNGKIINSKRGGLRNGICFHVIRGLHIIGGFAALFVFWIPIVTKKDGKLHKMFGWLYVNGMIIVAISAFYMGFFRIFIDHSATQELTSFSWLLFVINILSSAASYYGVCVLKFKNRKKSILIYLISFFHYCCLLQV